MASRPQPFPLHDYAIDNIRYIRDTMERAAAFTAVPGIGGVAMGLTAFAAALFVSKRPEWLLEIWLGEALVALLVGGASMFYKARGMQVSLASRPARKFALAFTPPLLVGAFVTVALLRAGVPQLVPGIWLSMYGAGIVTGGAFSVRVVPLMGIGFLCMGFLALFTPPAWTNLWLASGFGGLHVVFGMIIAKRYGG